MEQRTYAQLVKKYGGRIVKDPPRILLAGRIHIASALEVASIQQSRFPLQHADMNDTSADGLLHFSFILTTAGGNENNQFFVEDEIRQAAVFQSPIGEPIDEDHDQTFNAIRGEIYNSNFVEAKQMATEMRPSAIKCVATIFQRYYPDVAYKVQTGAGRWAAVSMEALPNPLEQVGKYLVIHDPKFVGAGLVRFPGNRHSKIEEVGDVSGSMDQNVNSSLGWRQALVAGLDRLVQ